MEFCWQVVFQYTNVNTYVFKWQVLVLLFKYTRIESIVVKGIIYSSHILHFKYRISLHFNLTYSDS